MNLVLNNDMSFPAMLQLLTEKFPQYKVEMKKNPLMKFEYIQVYKSAYVGVWVRAFPNKNRLMLIKTIPSTWARALLGGLIAMLIASGSQNKLRKEVADALMTAFKTTEQK